MIKSIKLCTVILRKFHIYFYILSILYFILELMLSIQSQFQTLKFCGVNILQCANHAYNLYESSSSCMSNILRNVISIYVYTRGTKVLRPIGHPKAF